MVDGVVNISAVKPANPLGTDMFILNERPIPVPAL